MTLLYMFFTFFFSLHPFYHHNPSNYIVSWYTRVIARSIFILNSLLIVIYHNSLDAIRVQRTMWWERWWKQQSITSKGMLLLIMDEHRYSYKERNGFIHYHEHKNRKRAAKTGKKLIIPCYGVGVGARIALLSKCMSGELPRYRTIHSIR